MSKSPLHTLELGESGPRLVFCHGLFGQGKNWIGIAKRFAGDHRVSLVDMPDHGRSPWTTRFDYLAAADTLARLLDASDPAVLVGHSMGGKIAMLTTLAYPERVRGLAVVDVSPTAYRSGDGFAGYVSAMRELDTDALSRRDQADEALREAVPDDVVRGFLLQNLRRDDGTWRWQVNLQVLGDGLEELRGWPEAAIADIAPYPGPVAWIAGAESRYVTSEYEPAMRALFPRVRRVSVKGAGHWVHADRPEVFVEVLRRFLEATPAEDQRRGPAPRIGSPAV